MKNIQDIIQAVKRKKELIYSLKDKGGSKYLAVAQAGFAGVDIPPKYDKPLREALSTIVSNIEDDIADKVAFLESMEKLATVQVANDD